MYLTLGLCSTNSAVNTGKVSKSRKRKGIEDDSDKNNLDEIERLIAKTQKELDEELGKLKAAQIELDVVKRKDMRKLEEVLEKRRLMKAQKEHQEQMLEKLNRKIRETEVNGEIEITRIRQRVLDVLQKQVSKQTCKQNNSEEKASITVTSSDKNDTVPNAIENDILHKENINRRHKIPFCVVCLQHNASIAIIPCGHLCLCKSDARKMSNTSMLKLCPLCKTVVSNTIEIKNIINS